MVNPNEDTEFNDALRAQGILPPKPPSRSPSPDIPHISQATATHLLAASANPDQLTSLLDNDNLDSDDERLFENYRRKRIGEMRQVEQKGRWGRVLPLGREDFVREVTEGSKVDPETGVIPPPSNGADEDEDEGGMAESAGLAGTGVVVFLYKDAVPLSRHLAPLLERLAVAHPQTKFMSIRADLCIPNYPDRNVPTLLIYRNGEMLGNVVAGMGLNGMKTTVQDLEQLLIGYKAVERASDSLKAQRRASDDGDDDFDDMDDGVGAVNARGSGIRTGGGLGTGRRKDDSDDSDFDM